MNLQQLRYVVATADHGTMTAAAAAVHVAQPVLSRGIRALERELGLTLFERRGRNVALTRDGRLVVDAARRALAEVDGIHAIARASEPREALRVAATPTLEADLGTTLLGAFHDAHPTTRVRLVHCGGNDDVVAAVRQAEAELGVCDLGAVDDLESVVLDVREIVLISPPGSGLPDPFPLGNLGTVPLVLPGPGSPRRAQFDFMFEILGIAPPVALETDERASWIPAVEAGLGSCLWYRSRGEQARAHGAEVRSFDTPLYRPVGVVHRPGALSDAARAFLELARERIMSE